MSLGEQPAGSTGYTDTNIGANGFPVPGGKKVYYYQVVAIDTVSGERKTSKPIKVIVKPDAGGGPGQPPEGNPGAPIVPGPNPGNG
jgi:hypothetical protein